MEEAKKKIISKDEQLKINLLKIMTLLGIGVCMVVVNNNVYLVDAKKESVSVVETVKLNTFEDYLKPIEVDVEALKKEKKFYENFGKGKQIVNRRKFKEENIKYDKKIPTKIKKYHRKG